MEGATNAAAPRWTTRALARSKRGRPIELAIWTGLKSCENFGFEFDMLKIQTGLSVSIVQDLVDNFC